MREEGKRRKKKEGEREKTKEKKRQRGLRNRYVDQISSVSAHNNCGLYPFAKRGEKRKRNKKEIKRK